ncbi:hypothetical protein V6N13_082050 [Hibiscus sabdariffa]|uniref:Uncharacterized protein n=1 Tax=Hibiscus sabdariffa TaxID=183260 RepID=A0ABR2DCX0_9ROSI
MEPDTHKKNQNTTTIYHLEPPSEKGVKPRWCIIRSGPENRRFHHPLRKPNIKNNHGEPDDPQITKTMTLHRPEAAIGEVNLEVNHKRERTLKKTFSITAQKTTANETRRSPT